MEEVEGMQMKKKKLDTVFASADGYAERAEATGDITHMVRSDSLRKTAKAEAKELSSIKTQIENKLKDLP